MARASAIVRRAPRRELGERPVARGGREDEIEVGAGFEHGVMHLRLVEHRAALLAIATAWSRPAVARGDEPQPVEAEIPHNAPRPILA